MNTPASGAMGPFQAQVAYRQALLEAHLLFLERTYLEPWRAAGQVPPAAADAWLRGLIVETRPSPLLRAVVANTVVLCPPGSVLTLITQPAQMAAMQQLLGPWLPWLELLPLLPDAPFAIETYNDLLTSPAFWGQWRESHLLVFQCDGVMLRPLRAEEPWRQLGYVGAPWFRGERWSVLPRFNSQGECLGQRRCSVLYGQGLPEGLAFGNGGFSLRARELMLELSERFARAPLEPEDVFFSRHLAEGSWPLATLEQAATFACETLFHPDPVGMHCSWAYLEAGQQSHLQDSHQRLVAGLCSSPEVLSRPML